MERVVHAKLATHLDQLGFLYPHRYGFRRRHSTVQAIEQMNKWAVEAMEEKELTGFLFDDISKAFDSLNHKVLLGKLEHIGLFRSALKWFKSYIVDRWQCVGVKGELSETLHIDLGGTQGSIMGPLLLNVIYVNSLSKASAKIKVSHEFVY
ncbi:Hypothetical predicted protein [Paramuricea clavata]|uniref:Reverse transcriptase domain-containing protein n=1 Tax=Paramuricea clavata TaxID=317549 RepID=A0A6S7HD58_PARCT|nr:Hypothetical predicted protein [Paramuricea clavata]